MTGDVKRGYTVYRVDYVTGMKEAIGCIPERREKERKGNLLALLVEARKVFGRGPSEAIHIVLDSPRDAKELPAKAVARGNVLITSFGCDKRRDHEAAR
ncbi:MAG: hypothetical protein M1550_06595 [Deltaproteobacteria bacterium]|nr:hypothetical protein [Deltaproteobacteria bacterium]